ncbi:hypothetical protein DMC30DRAFT_388593 [Rhodotorula diobovata]|uniref:Uncharacterized protein n=1 Tax=Rhodotorula diobovata TaxID=5288 RepID=A0A5C5G5Z4_9BASI|nr:hypothetical protein DMC30DRAFT_388593 [Rhodotorula diobovata]
MLPRLPALASNPLRTVQAAADPRFDSRSAPPSSSRSARVNTHGTRRQSLAAFDSVLDSWILMQQTVRASRPWLAFPVLPSDVAERGWQRKDRIASFREDRLRGLLARVRSLDSSQTTSARPIRTEPRRPHRGGAALSRPPSPCRLLVARQQRRHPRLPRRRTAAPPPAGRHVPRSTHHQARPLPATAAPPAPGPLVPRVVPPRGDAPDLATSRPVLNVAWNGRQR